MISRKHEWGHCHQALVDIEDISQREQFPEFFENAKYIEVELKVGEMLFIPKLWWHHVRTLENSIAVNFWFQHLGSEQLKLTKYVTYFSAFVSLSLLFIFVFGFVSFLFFFFLISLYRFWPHIEEYLLAVEQMQETTPVKMVIVLQFLGVKVTPEEAQSYIQDPLKLMVLPKFIASFSNAANSPFISGKETDEFAVAIQNKVFTQRSEIYVHTVLS